MFGDIYVVVCWLYVFIIYGVIQCFVVIFCILDCFYILFGLVLQFLVWEGQIMYGDFQCVVVVYLFVQFMIVVVGNIGEDGDDVLFFWCFVDNYFIVQCVQFIQQQLVGDVDWLCVVYVVYWFLDDMFVVVGYVQYVVVGQYCVYFGNW